MEHYWVTVANAMYFGVLRMFVPDTIEGSEISVASEAASSLERRY
jgi:hypothetical protein